MNNIIAWGLCCGGASIVWGVGPLTHAPHFRAAVTILGVSAAPRTPGVIRQQSVVRNVNYLPFGYCDMRVSVYLLVSAQ